MAGGRDYDESVLKILEAQRRIESERVQKLETTPLDQVVFTTFDGRKISAARMTHSHVSNNYWFCKIFKPSHVQFFERVLNERFDGEALDYRPHSESVNEIKNLLDMGLLISTNYGYDIFISENNKIGEIRFI